MESKTQKIELTQEQIKGLIVQNQYFKELQDFQNEAVFRHQLIQAINRNTATMEGLMNTLREGLVSTSEEDQQEEPQTIEPKKVNNEKKEKYSYKAVEPEKEEDIEEEDTDEEEKEEEPEEEEGEKYVYTPKKIYHGGK